MDGGLFFERSSTKVLITEKNEHVNMITINFTYQKNSDLIKF